MDDRRGMPGAADNRSRGDRSDVEMCVKHEPTSTAARLYLRVVVGPFFRPCQSVSGADGGREGGGRVNGDGVVERGTLERVVSSDASQLRDCVS